jgi:rod shape-determining protein MreD
MMSPTIYLAAPIMLLLAVVQSAILPHFPILGYVPQLLFLVALAWGSLRGVNEGLLWGFVAGFCQDLFSTTPMGLTSLAFTLAIFAVIMATQIFPSNRFFLPILQAAVATLIFLLLYLFLLRVTGYGVGLATIVAFLPLILLHGVLILPVYWLLNGLIYAVQPRRIQV